MYCAQCGNQLSPDACFCAKCGYKVADSGTFCSQCGSRLERGAAFCATCGAARRGPETKRPPRVSRRPSLGAVLTPLRKKKRATIAIACVLAAAVIVGLVFALLPRDSRTPGLTGSLELGAENHIADATIGAEGGTIQIEDEASALYGMTITVPQGAYGEQLDFAISEAEIVSHTFGADVTPITPLITIDNGEVFANQPLEIKVPIKLADGEFAMGFYYNVETGRLEGIPFAEQSDESITLVTSHFSDIAIVKANEGKILGRAVDVIDSGFRPGHDDFITPNYGSILAPKGHCGGQSVAEIYYYSYLKYLEGGKDLHGRFDNNDLEPATPRLWQDDAEAVRLCSVLQYVCDVNWHRYTSQKEYIDFDKQNDDEKTFYALAYAMWVTGEPQLALCYGKSGGHAVVAYKIEEDTIYIADPNFPGQARTITLDRVASAAGISKPKFIPYYSAANAGEAKNKMPYDDISYWGAYALVNFDAVAMNWDRLVDGGGVPSGVFPADPKIQVCRGMREDPLYGAVLDEVPISDGLVVSKTMLDELAVNGGGRLYCAFSSAVEKDRLKVYLDGEEAEYRSQPGLPEYYHYIQLKPGENEVGFLYENWYQDLEDSTRSGYRFVNFYRYTIIYDDGTALTEPPAGPADEAAAFEGTWQFYQDELLRVQGSDETMAYVDSLFSAYGGQQTFTGGPAYSSLEDYIQQTNADYAHELVPLEVQCLVIEKNADGTYRADYLYSWPGNPKTNRAGFEDVEVSGNTIALFNQAESGRFGFELTWNGEALTGIRVEAFDHPYGGLDLDWIQTDDPDQAWAGGYGTQDSRPAGYDAEEVRSCELVKVGD